MGVRIQVLPATVANQIAAGEVIERPASVVKELLENALDAKATAISVELGFGGLNDIKIIDNGFGIVAEDLPLAIAAHATSKIVMLTDLYALKTMGFRGEALASIASVSRMTIISKPLTQEHAMMLTTHPDGQYQLTPCARSQGTTVEVRDLFFNAPVRKKFLKSERIEFQAVETMVRRFALSSPHIGITLKHNERDVFVLPPAEDDFSLLQRVKKIIGKPFVEQSYYLEVSRAGMHLRGWISQQNYQRSQQDKQYIYVNQRMVKDKLLSHALKQAYEEVMYPGRYPSCLLYLNVPAEAMDVNVHPTKHEVRFQQPRLVHDLLVSQIQQRLHSEPAFIEERIKNIPLTISPLTLAETYTPTPIQPTQHSSSIASWISLNTQFAIVFIQNNPYLVDLNLLQRNYVHDRLTQMPKPLESRLLLSPMRYVIKTKKSALVDQALSLFERLGLQAHFVTENEMLIRTVPVAVPQLDIKSCLDGLFQEQEVNEKKIINYFSKCITVDGGSLEEKEQNELSAYLAESMQSNTKMTGCVEMSKHNCEKILGFVDNCPIGRSTPTFRGVSAESIGPADAPRGVGIELTCQQTLGSVDNCPTAPSTPTSHGAGIALKCNRS